MKVLLFGASGNIGSAIATELLARGHEVTGATRTGTPVPGLAIPVLRKSASDAAEVAGASAGQDAVICAAGPRHGVDKDEVVLVGAALGLIGGLRQSGVKRLLIVGGAGSLEVAPGKALVESADFKEEWKPNARAQAAALDVYRGAKDLDWTYISPAALIVPGEKIGKYRLGGDQLLTDDQGSSLIHYPDYAMAMVDELEKGTAIRRRITVAY